MKRDMDLARKILLEVEEHGPPRGWLDLAIPEYGSEEVSYHVELLAEAGLIEAQNLTSSAGYDWRPKRLTWAGHEFLDAARKDTLWQKAKSMVLEKTGGLSLEVLKVVLLELAKRAVFGG